MAKKLIFFLVVALAAEIITALIVISALKPTQLARGGDPNYDNPRGREVLTGRFRNTLELITENYEEKLTASQLARFRSGTAPSFAPRTTSSPINYFYSRTGTSNPWTNYDFSAKVKGQSINQNVLAEYLLALSKNIDRAPQNAELVIENSQATTFRPHRIGEVLELTDAAAAITAALYASTTAELSVPVHIRPPQIKLGNLNNLGIKEFLGRGQSDFRGSSPARIQNVKTGSAQYRGLIIMPGEEFSFNEHLGPIDAAHGYRPELVIKPEGAVPEFGGGLCQVSTTAFRAAFFTGLPITQRRNHSYAVAYYEWISDDMPRAVGLDATIYTGVQDMKFVNDSPGAILVWTYTEGTRLYFDFYGTPDDREILVDGPHPYDRRSSGAVKSKVSRTVLKSGSEPEILTYDSHYVPPKTYTAVEEYPEPVTEQPTTEEPTPPTITN